MTTGPRPTRRDVLSAGALGAAVVLTGCGADARDGGSARDDRTLAESALSDEQAFGAWCAAVGRRHASLRREARRLSRTQDLYVGALADALAVEPTPRPDGRVPKVPPSPDAARRLVARRCEALGASRAADALASTEGALAQLLGSMSAGHAVVAEQWRR